MPRNYCEIPLTQGRIALIDATDFFLVQRYKWCATRPNNRGTWYAATRRPKTEGGGKSLFMHRFILDTPADKETDHINGNGLDNRRENLRVATHSQNQQNRHVASGKSRYLGVRVGRQGKRWQAAIRISGHEHYLGTYDTQLQAALAYDKAALNAWGMWAGINFPVASKEAR